MSPAANRSRRGATPVLMRGLLVLGFLLAVGAIAVAVFSEDVRFLKLAALLGVWAALATAFPVVYFRRTARAAEQKTEESKRTYELELHREISARREYEIGVSEAAREDAETRHREELAGLREQLDRLNTTLSGLLDGDLLFERLTLSAESTRVRQVGTESGRGRLAAMARTGQIEAPEATGPYIGQQSGAPVVAGPVFRGSGGPYPVREDDTVQFPRATFGPGGAPPAAAPTGPPVVESVVPEPAVIGQPAPDVIDPEPVLQEEPQPTPTPEPAPEPELESPEPDAPEPEVREPESSGPDAPEPATAAPEAPEPGAPEPTTAEPTTAEPATPEPEAPEPTTAAPEAAAPEAADPEMADPEMGDPEAAGPAAAEPVPVPEEVEPAAPAAVQSFSEPVPLMDELADEEPVAEPAYDAGHSAGISVADLLAAYGATEGTPRRRRRAED